MALFGSYYEVRVGADGCTEVVWRRGEGASVAGPDTTAQKIFSRE